MSKTYRFEPAKKAIAKGLDELAIERSLRGKIKRRKEMQAKREEVRRVKGGEHE
jgi:hypothetical protein